MSANQDSPSGTESKPRPSRGTESSRTRGRGRGGKTSSLSGPKHGDSGTNRSRSGSNNNSNSNSTSAGQRLKGRALHAKPGSKETEQNSQNSVNDNSDKDGNEDADVEDDENVCFICADTVIFYALGECDHRTCHVCNLRLRALFKSKACPYCKTDLETVIYTSNSESTYDELLKTSLDYSDESLNIKFDSKEAYDATMHTLQFNCPHSKCHYVDSNGWSGLKDHVRKEHSKQFCELCLKHKMSFSHEHKLFTKGQLRVHYSRGDGTGFTGHPECQFCRISFYDNDQLFDHCRKRHEQCFLCVRGGVGRQVYYANYNTLEDHFNREHYPCRNAQCLEKKFVVFDNKIDLQSHELEEHGSSIVGQRARREAKQINLNFHYSTNRGPSSGSMPGASASASASASRSGSANNNTRIKGNKARQSSENSSPSTMTVNEPDAAGVSIAGRRRPAGFGRVSDQSTARQQQQQQQPVSNDYSRAAAKSSSAEPSTSEPEPESETLWPTLGAGSNESSGPMRDRAPTGFGRLSETANQSTAPSSSAASVSEQTLASHQELLQRVSAYLSHREQPVSRFRNLTTKYKTGQVSADDYVQNCWLLFLTVPGKNAKEMIQKTIKSVADLLPNTELKAPLLRALNEHRIKQQQFPALTPLTSSTKKTDASAARVLVIKQGASNKNTRSLQSGGWTKPASPSSSPRPASPAVRNTGALSEVKRTSSAVGLSSSAFPSLGAGPSPSSSSASLSTMASRLQIGGNAASTGHNSYSAKIGQHSSAYASNSDSLRSAGFGANLAASGAITPASNAAFPDLPPASVPKRKVIPFNPNAASAWDVSGSQTSSTTTTTTGNRKQQRSNGKGKQVLFHVG
ncbi:hypothetical protein LPJ64_006272 [Coemansia asiatica]|uniref:RING-type E3 ubiquitin transferase n=1 Tax=Coemansia asiatica TaxID=1052880 RepID=A0A9W8CH93_9FUNG|nr:hypothetical protein LPJ64_006272 [Coemansia asiatica]